MNFDSAIVFDKTEFAEFIHEEAHPRPGGAHEARQRLLADIGKHARGRAFLAKIRQQQKHACQAFLAGIKKLVYQILFNSNVAREHIGQQQLGNAFSTRPRHHPARLGTVSAPDVPHMSAKAGRCGARCGTGHAVNQTPARKRQTETRTRPPPTFSLPNGKHRLSVRGLANPEKPVLWPFRAFFWVPLTWLTAFRSAYLGPQVQSRNIGIWLTAPMKTSGEVLVAAPFAHSWPTLRPDAAFRAALADWQRDAVGALQHLRT